MRFLPLLTAVALGAALGVFSRLTDRFADAESLGGTAVRGLGNAPTLWLITAFVVGYLCRSLIAAAFLATVSLAIAVAVYYFLIDMAGEREGVDLVRVATGWLAVAAVSGPVFGAAGAACRAGGWRAVLGAVVVSSSIAGIGLFVIADRLEYWPNSDTEVTFGALQFAAGLFAGPLLVRGLAARISVLCWSAILSVAAAAITFVTLGLMRALFNA
ncbi:MAG TPA: DUF6518 family protein [Tepidiformaceae bacterium]|nr:DUF6518 family protein [Tepidiformaceae bacterium]